MSPPSRMRDLATLGWDDAWSAAFEPYRDECLTPGRIAVPHRGEYDVVTAETELRAKIAPRLRRSSAVAELPVVGDNRQIEAGGPASFLGRLKEPRGSSLSGRPD
jgi:hypothetical protein